jgi:hypothetical protein
VQRIGQRLEGLRFGAATSAWPERFMRTGASDKLQRSIEDFVLHAEAKSEGEVESRAPVGPY